MACIVCHGGVGRVVSWFGARYVRALGAFYLRLVGKAAEIYTYLEPLYNDYRKVNRRTLNGAWEQTTMDQFVQELLTAEMVCDIAMPFLQKRQLLERAGVLTVRPSAPSLASQFRELWS
jgi:pre-mRNA-splicing factor 38A